ncbi:MAG: hypothetical protein LBJ02_01905 [Bifidobacteriaceae bacterium]|nr:hypothetical protein [Bifidobacteriaceae bacterium]
MAIVLTSSVFLLISAFASRILRLSSQYSGALAGVVVLVAGLSVSFPADMLEQGTGSTGARGTGIWLGSVFGALAAAPSSRSAIGAAIWIVVVAATALVASRFRQSAAGQRQNLLFRRTRPVANNPWFGDLWFETLATVRMQQFIITLVVVPCLVIVVYFASRRSPLGANLAPSLAALLAILPLMVALYAVGRTSRSNWVLGTAAGLPNLWIAPKAVANFVVCGALSLGVLALEIPLGLIAGDSLQSLATQAPLGLVVALVSGAIVPYSEQQPLSTIAGAFLATVLYATALLGLSWIGNNSNSAVEVFATVLLIVGLGATYVALGRRQRDYGAARV